MCVCVCVCLYVCVCVCMCMCAHVHRSEKIVSRFLELDLENDDLESFLKDFVLPTGKDIL